MPAELGIRPASAAITRMPAVGPTTRILIVEQDRQVRVALSFMFSARRFDQVRCVRSAERAVAISEQFQPEIAFLDLELPLGGGLTVARHMARTARNRPPRLIGLTQYAEYPTLEAWAAGFERFLARPVSRQELDNVLGSHQTTT